MFTSSEEDDQLVCWNCEEAIHSDALYCPYCTADIKKHVPVRKTPVAQIGLPKKALSHEARVTRSSWPFFTLLSFVFVLVGTAFLFLAVMVLLFSTDGLCTLTWHEKSFSSYFGLGLALFFCGLYFVQQDV
jgi:hypothetical protein